MAADTRLTETRWARWERPGRYSRTLHGLQLVVERDGRRWRVWVDGRESAGGASTLSAARRLGPLTLAGKSQSRWRERIGNAVPPPAARAIAEQMLVTLVHAALGSMELSNGAVWVFPDGNDGAAELTETRGHV